MIEQLNMSIFSEISDQQIEDLLVISGNVHCSIFDQLLEHVYLSQSKFILLTSRNEGTEYTVKENK